MSGPLYTRPAILEAIATVRALGETSTSTRMYLHWSNREHNLRTQAGTITDAEEQTILSIAERKTCDYDKEAVAR